MAPVVVFGTKLNFASKYDSGENLMESLTPAMVALKLLQKIYHTFFMWHAKLLTESLSFFEVCMLQC